MKDIFYAVGALLMLFVFIGVVAGGIALVTYSQLLESGICK